MTWLVPGSIILYESKVSSIVILVKIAFCINIEQDMDLFLWINLDISPAKHCIKHGEVGGVRRETSCVRDATDMMVEVRIKVGVVSRPRTTSPGLGLGDQVCV